MTATRSQVQREAFTDTAKASQNLKETLWLKEWM